MSNEGDVRPLLAVDMGGTKVAAALVTHDGAIRAAAVEPTCQDGPQPGIAQVIGLLERVLAQAGTSATECAAVGIGIPAVLDAGDRVVWAPNLAGWREVELATPVAAALGLPVAVEYDGHTAALAEWWLGGGRGCTSFVDVIIGTGIGGGVVLDGRLVRGVNRLAGAVGWSALTTAPPEALQAGAPERSLGFWEAQAAGPGIARRAQQRLAAGERSTLSARGDTLAAAHVFEAAIAGDALAQAVLDETADLIGVGIANIISLVNPERVVLGGGVGSRCGPLLGRITQVVAGWAQPISAQSCAIVVSPLGPEAGLLGAAFAARLRFGAAPTA